MATSQPTHVAAARTVPGRIARVLTNTVVELAGVTTIVVGIWSFADPPSFARWVQFPVHHHFLHDLGAFQIGIGVTLVLALLWRDSIAVALGGFFTGNTLHALSHFVDLDRGGRPTDWVLLSVLSIVVLVALVGRLRQTAIAPDADRCDAPR